MVLGDAFSKSEPFVWILYHISRSRTWSLFALKVSHLAELLMSPWSFMWWWQFIDWSKFETRPTSLLNFGTANESILTMCYVLTLSSRVSKESRRSKLWFICISFELITCSPSAWLLDTCEWRRMLVFSQYIYYCRSMIWENTSPIHRPLLMIIFFSIWF